MDAKFYLNCYSWKRNTTPIGSVLIQHIRNVFTLQEYPVTLNWMKEKVLLEEPRVSGTVYPSGERNIDFYRQKKKQKAKFNFTTSAKNHDMLRLLVKIRQIKRNNEYCRIIGKQIFIINKQRKVWSWCWSPLNVATEANGTAVFYFYCPDFSPYDNFFRFMWVKLLYYLFYSISVLVNCNLYIALFVMSSCLEFSMQNLAN